MERIKIKVDIRDVKGKEKAKKIRKNGFVPAIVYARGTNTILSIPPASLKQLRSMHFSESTIIDMEMGEGKGAETIHVLLKDIQFHPLTEAVSHIDFLKVSLEDKIRVRVPIILKGEAKGVKDEGGILEQVLRDLELEGLPLEIPQKIEIDVSELSIGHSLHVEDLTVAGNLRIVTDPKATVVTVVVKKEEIIEEAPAVEGAAPLEPEVIKEKKEEQVEGEETKEGKEKQDKDKDKDKKEKKEEKEDTKGKKDKKEK
jgi:large subunit ribosomal protein L25